jgi:hypothetical protein
VTMSHSTPRMAMCLAGCVPYLLSVLLPGLWGNWLEPLHEPDCSLLGLATSSRFDRFHSDADGLCIFQKRLEMAALSGVGVVRGFIASLAFYLRKREGDVGSEDKRLNFCLLARSNMGQFDF